jgi:transmembrane sensor
MARPGEDARREREAADWFARLNRRTLSMEDLERFKAWRADPDCRAAYGRIEGLWRDSQALAHDPDIVALRETVPDRRRAPSGRRRILWAGAAVAAVAAAGVLGLTLLDRPTVFVTGVGETRTLRLADGSRLSLDTDSRVEVLLEADRRRLVLRHGQALFDVASDPARPFVVRAGDLSVRAIGTQFDVRVLEGGARVTLVEGRVVVDDAAERRWTLAAGERLEAAGAGAAPVVARLAPDAMAAATSWTTGRLLFEATPLSEAVAEINRYAQEPIRLAAPGFETRPLSGSFDTGDPAAFAEAVAAIYGLRLARTDAGLVLRPPA